MDSYQPIYDAVRSRISNGDIGGAVRDAAERAFDISHITRLLHQEFSIAAYEMARPSAIYRPALLQDGDKWCALFGENLQEGVAGFGDTPEAAMRAFDHAWLTERTPAAVRASKNTVMANDSTKD